MPEYLFSCSSCPGRYYVSAMDVTTVLKTYGRCWELAAEVASGASHVRVEPTCRIFGCDGALSFVPPAEAPPLRLVR
jgi:hypothetical protein